MATESAKEKPQLLAFLICERVVVDEGIATVWRIIDSFNFIVNLPETVPKEVRDKMNVQLRCEVFTRWGPPFDGDYEAELGLNLPDGQEVNRTPQTFNRTGEYGFAQVTWDIVLGLATTGTYNWVLYLDGAEIARHPFRVNITREVQTPEPK